MYRSHRASAAQTFQRAIRIEMSAEEGIEARAGFKACLLSGCSAAGEALLFCARRQPLGCTPGVGDELLQSKKPSDDEPKRSHSFQWNRRETHARCANVVRSSATFSGTLGKFPLEKAGLILAPGWYSSSKNICRPNVAEEKVADSRRVIYCVIKASHHSSHNYTWK